MAHFHPLRVAAVHRETEECVAIELEVPAELAETFRFQPGQHLTLRTRLDGEEVRRSYSICSGANEARLRVAVKQLKGGRFSTFVNQQLRAGDTLEVMSPSGRFTVELDPAHEHHYAGFAVGSGITPVISILKSILVVEPRSRFTLFYGNRSTDSIIFREELEGLKNLYLGRLSLHHVLSREHTGSDLFSGRMSPEKIEVFLDTLIDPVGVDAFFICGPESMIHAVRDALLARGVSRERIRFELFGTELPAPPPAADLPEVEATVEIRLDGNVFDFPLSSRGQTILEGALRAGADLPYACKGGVCSTCRARLLEGEVTMDVNYALEPDEVAAGYILTCQSHPRTDHVKVDFDA